MISFVTFKWRQPGYPTVYGPEHVHRWAAQVRVNYGSPHRLILVTDDPEGIDPSIEIVPLWSDFGTLGNRHGDRYPSCFRRLRIWASDIAPILGERIVMMDLDCSIVGRLEPIVDRSEDVVLWRDPNPPFQYNGGFVMLTAGARPQVWERFEGAYTAMQARQAGYRGSDQAVLTYLLGTGEAVWTEADGVLSYKKHVRPAGRLPSNARVIFFHGKPKPWAREVPEWARG